MEKVEPSVPDANVTTNVVIKADSPIRAKEQDLLGRDRIAARVAKVISRSFGHEDASDESLVVGIEGEWGSGKTSFINLILENLKSFKQRDYLIIKFNPWNFSDQNELVTDFFDSIVDALKRTDRESYEKGARKIREYCSKLLKKTELKIEPKISILGVEAGLGGIYKTVEEEPLERQKEAINELLGETGKRFVIVIDDIDRLDSQETKLVFKLVRMTANFANTVFLLAYDRGNVGKRITENGIEGEGFLKKIVQLPFPLPRVDQRDLFQILFREIRETIKSFDGKSWGWESWEDFFDPDLDEDNFHPNDLRRRWEDLFDSCLIKLFPTVRDIRRYINGLRLDLEIIGKEEVNPVDFLGIEAIRILAPNVYFAMAEEKDTFAFPAVEKIYGKHRVDPLPFPGMTDRSSTPDEKTRKEICERIIEDKSPEGLSGKIWKIVEELFPQMDSDPTPEFRQTWRKELRVCSGAVFDRYFCLSVPSASLSEKSLNDFLSTVGDVSASVEKLRKFEEEGKSGLVIERLFDHLDDLNDRQRENLLVSVLDFTESTTGRGPLFSGSESRESRATHLCYGILKRIPSQEKLELAARVIDSSQGVFSPAYLLESFYQHLQYAEEKELPEPPLFTKEDMRRLNGICIGKIEEAGKDGSLSDSKRLLYVLSYWKKRGTENAAKDYVAGLLKTKDGLFRFLTAFVYKEYFQTVGDPSVEITRKILREEIVEFIDLGELDRLVDGLDPGSLTEEQADVIELYRNPASPFSR